MPVSEQDREAAGEYLAAIIPSMPNLAAAVAENQSALARAFAANREAARQRGAEERQAVIVAWLRRRRAWDESPKAARFKLADLIEANAHMEKRDG